MQGSHLRHLPCEVPVATRTLRVWWCLNDETGRGDGFRIGGGRCKDRTCDTCRVKCPLLHARCALDGAQTTKPAAGPVSGFDGGRYKDRTCDTCRVKCPLLHARCALDGAQTTKPAAGPVSGFDGGRYKDR